MIIVFDSNIWLSELGLRSGVGAAVRFYLKHRHARVAVPEVVRLEVGENLTIQLMRHIDGIRSAYSQLLTAFGTLREIVLPTEKQVQERVEELFASLDVERLEVPFSLNSARESFLKTIRKLPPSHHSQQFKDGVLWADCLSLLESDSVVLVTADKAFYQDQVYSKGLASTLREEASGHPNELRVVPTLADVLESVKANIVVDGDDLQAAFFAQHRESVDGTLERHGFVLGPLSSFTYTLFATENPSTLFVDFVMCFDCSDVPGEGRTGVVLSLSGDGLYMPATGQFSDLRNFGEHIRYRKADGSETETRNHVLYADGIVIGHRQISHVTRFPLPAADEP